MATTINARDVYLQSQTRLLPVTIPAGYDFAGNVTGTINNVPAPTVTTQANNGQIANTETAQYRNNAPPTNAPAGGVNPVIVINDDGSRDITLAWTYTQGALPADGFILYYKQGSAAILATDPAYSLPATARSYRFMGAHQNTQYRAGIAAFRKTETGYQITAIYQPSTTPSWIVPATSTLINGVAVGLLTHQSLQGYNIQQQLEVSGSTILKGVIVPTDSGALKTGTITWNQTTGALTGGSGCAMTEWGIIGAKAGVASFTLESATGNAVLAGDLNTAGDVYATGKNTRGISILFGGTSRSVDYSIYGFGSSVPTSDIRAGVVGKADAGTSGVLYNVGVAGIGGATNKGIGVVGQGTLISGYFENSVVANSVSLATQTAGISIVGPMLINNSTLVTNLNAQKWNGMTTDGTPSVGGGNALTANLTAKKPGVSTQLEYVGVTLADGRVGDIAWWPRA